MIFPVFADGYHAIPAITGSLSETKLYRYPLNVHWNSEISLHRPASSPFEAVSTSIFLGIKPQLPGFIPPTLTDFFYFMAASPKTALCLLDVHESLDSRGPKAPLFLEAVENYCQYP